MGNERPISWHTLANQTINARTCGWDCKYELHPLTIYVTIQGETDLTYQNGGFHFFPEFYSLNP